MSLSPYERSSGCMSLCGNPNCMGSSKCARWKYKNKKAGGYVLMCEQGPSIDECPAFVSLEEYEKVRV